MLTLYKNFNEIGEVAKEGYLAFDFYNNLEFRNTGKLFKNFLKTFERNQHSKEDYFLGF